MIDLDLQAQSILNWLKTVQVEGQPGRFRMCNEGALVAPDSTTGLGASCFALKIAYTTRIISAFSVDEIKEWMQYICSFQAISGGQAGYFEDPRMLASVDGLRFRRFHLHLPFSLIKDLGVRRAETRQACAALLSTDREAPHELTFVPKTVAAMQRYCRKLDWRNPWSAGSHLSHMAFFLQYNANYFGKTEVRDKLLPILWQELDRVCDHDTGAWLQGSPDTAKTVNGAMKVLTAYAACDRQPEQPEKLIDLCLATVIKADGCHLLDSLYVLHQCAKICSHRKDEIKEVAEDAAIQIEEFWREDGAYSFFPDRSQTSYYGQKVSLGYLESDLHGTHLFTWALCIIDEILNDFHAGAWKLPIT
ncbi:MAG: hypothetical protein JXA52_01660 [Planctomycetes bacterium]|nr:hypothetical protein [Planctomycetota bacterium]